MAKRLTDNIITGYDRRLGLYLYYSPYFKQNIVRRGSSLTSERTKKDPAFKGFRQSSSRLKQASPIAASLYKLVPAHVKEYALYRTLTGAAIKMLKEGIEETEITETLRKKYIDPRLEAANKGSENRATKEPLTRDRVNGMADFTGYPQMTSGIRKITRTRRSHLLQKIREGQSSAEYFSSTASDPLLQTRRTVSESPIKKPDASEKPKQRTRTTSGLIYLSRLPECKKLKIWLRPVSSLVSDSVI
jgi:hypothetical protein